MPIKLSTLKASIVSCFGLILLSSIAIEAKAQQTQNLLVEYGVNSDNSELSRGYQNFPPSNITNSVVSQSLRSSDELCLSYRNRPYVAGYAQGSFTRANASESLYLVHIGDSCGSRGIGTIRIMIARGNQVTAYGDVSGNYGIKTITDINNDGINEILLEASWLGQGYLSVWNRFLEIRPGGILTLAQFDTYSNNTGAITQTDTVTNIRYEVITEMVSKVYYELGSDNKLSGLRSDWMVRACSRGEMGTQSQCTALEPLFSYNIPLSGSNADFFSAYRPYFENWFHRTCHNTCKVFN